jgi:flavin reductase (DIM6/NTAB) family NADH-FMN oxidoreductase RutF
VSDVDAVAFRRAIGQFPSGIVVVTTSAGDAMTASAFTSVSLEPPLVLFCVAKIAPAHDAVVAAGSWTVSILAETVLLDDGRLDGALATLECRTTAVHDGGDHTFVVGQVAAVSSPAHPAGTPSRGPLIQYAGAYRRLRPGR